MIVIHNFARGGRGLRVAWLCEEMGLPYRVEFVTFPPSAEYRTLNPMGSVPFLQDEGGVAINESVAMMLYLAQRYGPTPLLPGPDDPRLSRVMQMTVFSEATLGAGLNPLMAARFGAPEDDKRNWSVRVQEARLDDALAYLIGLLGEEPYLAGEELTLADMCVVTGLGIWRGALGKALPPEIVAYQARATARPGYQRAQAAIAGGSA